MIYPSATAKSIRGFGSGCRLRNQSRFYGLRLRILTFTSLYPNKVNPLQGIFIHQRVIHLARCPETTVEVIAPVPYFPPWLDKTRWQHLGRVPQQEEIGGVRVHHPRFPLVTGISMPVHGLLEFLGSLGLARRLHNEINFDCIDAHFVYPDGFAAVLLGKALGLPVIVSARGTDINVYPSFRIIRPMLRWTLTHAAGAIAVSADLKKKMTDLGAPEPNVRVISNGVDVERFRRLDVKESRRKLGLPEEVPIAVSVGALIESKGHHLLISAVEELTRRIPKLRLHIIGEGVYRARLEELVREQKLQDRVFLMGNRPNEELNSWFSAADISCLMSSREGWPNVVSESLACGTPVLATPAGGIPEIIVSPDLGMLVERDVGSIAVGLEQALSQHWDREKIARQASRRSWNAVASEVESFLASIILRYRTNHPVTGGQFQQ
jgi:teichuronic acid biosynthesis glycosyltransferase TuaC